MADSTTLQRLSLRQLIWACLGVMAAAFVVVSAAAVAGQVGVARAVDELSNEVVPIQGEVEVLRRAFTDREAGQRSYLLTGNPASLEPFDAGAVTADRMLTHLREELAGDPTGSALLDRVAAAAAAWTTDAAEPQIAARRSGPVPADEQASMTLESGRVFDRLRTELRALAAHTDAMAEAQLMQIQSVQRTANIVQAVGAVMLVLSVIGAVIAVRCLLTRPVGMLVDRVKRVADGDYDRPIIRPGLRETAEIADAVEQMRLSLRASTDRLIDSELRDEQARIAAELNDRVIQRVFGLGLGLTAASARRDPDLQPFIDETDVIIRDLREVIFNLDHAVSPLGRPSRIRSAIIDVVEGSVSALGFTPTLEIAGPVDDTPIPPELHAAVLAVVRESLSNVVRHSRATAAGVTIEVTGDKLRITVRDNGVGLASDNMMGRGRRNIASQAEQFGGTATVSTADSGTGTVVEWAVPLQPVGHLDAVTTSAR
ncbi:CHASE3 domain-containing protein [Mycolicibacterium austroafricanum]|jgi:signal transduction histidine kinase|uniref:sensor histidine kinase n=1 Tax=Mycolicibacterium austroafricanum TaxID=39687 RepID=UPI001CA31CC9|nr:CHASE3 domain-containing protein [Mycolicibacterium austroafricanum]QZT58191.1 CHASE3 domain-containing protein [Mycolicibacterium austroafricanum]